MKEIILRRLEEYSMYESSPDNPEAKVLAQSNLGTFLEENFYRLFDHYLMRVMAHKITYIGSISISTVNGEDGDQDSDLFCGCGVFSKEAVQALVSLDNRMMVGNLEMIADLSSGINDDLCHQFWFATPDLGREFAELENKHYAGEEDKRRYVNHRLAILHSFLLNYEKDPRLIEVWSGLM